MVDLPVELRPLARRVLSHGKLDTVAGLIRSLPGWPGLEAQAQVAEVLSVHSRFPLSLKYFKALIKVVQKDVDSAGLFLDDKLAEIVVTALSKNRQAEKEEEDEAYYSYLLDAGILVSLRVRRAHNQVGFRVWDAGVALAEVCATHPKLLHNKVVLELGAGVGVTGILAAAYLQQGNLRPRKLILTDGFDDVVSNLHFNIELNKLDSFVQAELLDWRALSAAESCYKDVDILLIADCSYSQDINCWLLEALICLLKPIGAEPMGEEEGVAKPNLLKTAARGPIALLACTIRSEDTYQHFLDNLENSVLGFYECTDWANQTELFSYSISFDIKIFCIYRS